MIKVNKSELFESTNGIWTVSYNTAKPEQWQVNLSTEDRNIPLSPAEMDIICAAWEQIKIAAGLS